MSTKFYWIFYRKLQIAGAGMPPFLYYNSETKSVIEIESGGPPLGAFRDFNYEIHSNILSTGDIFFLMTDGFAERRNGQKQIFAWDRGKALLAKNNQLAIDQLIREFVNASDDWGGENPQDDDITFVVIKMK